MSFEREIDKLFDDAIDVHDTVWYSKTETLRDAILRVHDETITEECNCQKCDQAGE